MDARPLLSPLKFPQITKKDALEVAFDQLTNLTAFAGNGGFDKLVGVYGDDESISADEEIMYDAAELIGPDDPEDEDDED